MPAKKRTPPKKKSIHPTIAAAIVTTIGVVIVALLNPDLLDMLNTAPTETPIHTPAAVMETPMPSPVVDGQTATDTPVIPLPEFFDNFNTGFSPQWENTGSWRREDDMATLKAGVTQGRMVVGDVSWTNYTVEVDVTSGGDDFSSYLAGIVVHYRDEENFVQFVIDCDYPGNSFWQFVKNGRRYDVPPTDADLPDCTPYHVIVTVQDHTYSAYLNGELISSFNSDLFESGKVGLLSGYNYGEFPAAFDNFTVRP